MTNLVELNGEAVKPLPKAMPIFLQVLKVSASFKSFCCILLPFQHGAKGVPEAMPIFFRSSRFDLCSGALVI